MNKSKFFDDKEIVLTITVSSEKSRSKQVLDLKVNTSQDEIDNDDQT